MKLEIAYKKSIDDIRESTSVGIMKLMQEPGAIVEYPDPYVAVFPKISRYQFDLKSVGLSIETLKTYDCIVLCTNHDDFEHKVIRENACLVIDTRGIYRGLYENVIYA